MSQVRLSFTSELDPSLRKEIARTTELVVAKVHYDIDEPKPGDVSVLGTVCQFSESHLVKQHQP